MGAVAAFGIENDGLELAVNLLLLVLVIIWLALIYWTFSDARRRIADPLLIGCATAASLFPFVGTIVYLIVRPPEYLDDVRERELEIAAAQARLSSLEHVHCQYCGFEVEKDFLRCPSCLRRLREPCATCSRPLDPRWKICPYCEAEVGQAPPEPRRTRTRRTAAAASGSRQSSGQRSSSARAARQAEQQDGEQRAVAAERQRPERQRAERAERPVRASRERPPSAG
jgi:Double zinc ribbon